MPKKATNTKKTRKDAKEKVKQSLRERGLLAEHAKKFNSKATKKDCVEDLRKLQKEHPLKHITRNFYRAEGKYSDATWTRYFGTFLEFRRQAGLEVTRHQAALERQIAKHAAHDHYKEFMATEYAPYYKKYPKPDKKGRFKRIAVASDIHDIDADLFIWGAFVDTCKRRQPDIIVLNGDVFDCPEVSRYDKDPRDMKIKERVDFVRKQIFGPLRKACPNAQIDMVIGNHDLRVIKHLADRSPYIKVWMSDVMDLTLADFFCVDEFEINLVSKLDLHTFSKRDIKDQMRENYQVYYNCFAVVHEPVHARGLGISSTSGHTHKPKLEVHSTLAAGKISNTTTGCISKTPAEYVGGMDKYVQGFAFFHIDVNELTVQPENIVITGNAVCIDGVHYIRK